MGGSIAFHNIYIYIYLFILIFISKVIFAFILDVMIHSYKHTKVGSEICVLTASPVMTCSKHFHARNQRPSSKTSTQFKFSFLAIIACETISSKYLLPTLFAQKPFLKLHQHPHHMLAVFINIRNTIRIITPPKSSSASPSSASPS